MPNTKKRYGMPYMYQRTAEFAVDKYLVEHAELREGSIKDNWTDNSAYYSAGLYDNGRISGIGNIGNYVSIADYKEYLSSEEGKGVSTVSQILDYLTLNSEFKPYDDYRECIVELCKFTENGMVSESDADYQMHYRMLIQALFDEYSLDIASYKADYNKGKTSDEIEEEIYTYGNAYVNQRIMEFAVIRQLGKETGFDI